MSHIDTLKVYEEYVASGIERNQAKAMTNSLLQMEDRLHVSILNYLKELKSDFASQKLISILGAIIIAIGGFTLAELWSLSKDMEGVNIRISHLEKDISEIKK